MKSFVVNHRARFPQGVLTLALLLFGAPDPLSAQHHAGTPPQVVVSGSAELNIPPDLAHLVIAVETRARTSAAAASENATIQTAVLSAIRRAEVADAQVRTQLLQVTPEYEYPREGGRPTVTGYVARNSVMVEVRDVSRVGAVVDAALAQGATNIQGPRFGLSNPDSARREAVHAAVRSALADAEVIARAAGMQLGPVLEIVFDDAGPGPMHDGGVMMARATEAVETPVATGTVAVRASVRVRIALSP